MKVRALTIISSLLMLSACSQQIIPTQQIKTVDILEHAHKANKCTKSVTHSHKSKTLNHTHRYSCNSIKPSC